MNSKAIKTGSHVLQKALAGIDEGRGMYLPAYYDVLMKASAGIILLSEDFVFCRCSFYNSF